MKRSETELPGVCVIDPTVFGDRRGCFFETYNQRAFAALGIADTFVQDNHSTSQRGVIRGLHYQLGQAQAKIVRVISGAVFDVVVDVRRGSPHFGRWMSVILSAENRRMIYVPKGFAHGFAAVSEAVEFIYKCSDFYAPSQERGIIWNDPDIGVRWPTDLSTPQLSDKDLRLPVLSAIRPDELPVYSQGGA